VKRIGLGLVIPVVFALFVLLMAMRGGRFEYDEDEGLNLMKAVLVSDGHPLYQSVWSDQPPGMTWMLAAGFKVFGESVWVGRILVLGFSILLLWSLGRIVSRLHGEVAAWVAMAMLSCSFNYARMSLSVMIGLPAVAMATASLWLLLEWRMRAGPRQTRDVYLLAASAVLFAAGLLTKMFVVEMLPVVVVALLVPMGERGRPGGWMMAWAVIVAALFGAGCAVGHVDFGQTIGTHFHSGIGSGEGGKILLTWLRHDGFMVVLAVIAMIIARRGLWIAYAWLMVSLAVVLVHRPLWYHHLLIVSTPLAWMGGAGLAELWKRVRTASASTGLSRGKLAGYSRRIAVFTVIGLLGALWGLKVWREGERLRAPAARGDWEMVAALREAEGKWVFADRPMDAFYAGKRVPPEVAVLSEKRMGEGKMDEVAAGVIERYRPGRVEIGRFRFGERVREVLSTEYEVRVVEVRGKVYARR
jgi:hypothetical protein